MKPTPNPEATLLGCLISLPELLPDAIERGLRQPWFDDLRHGIVWREMAELHRAGQPVDFETLAEKLKANPAFKNGSSDTISFLTQLVASVPGNVEPGPAFEAVHTAHIKRELSALANDQASDLQTLKTDLENFVRVRLRKIGSEDLPDARPIITLPPPQQGDENELLRHRYLCRGAGALLVGQSGQGKSSLAMQMAILWSLGRDCFGFLPTRPLRVLIIQAENDTGDMSEMFSGISAGLQLTEQDRKFAGESVLIHQEDSLAGQDFLARVVEPLVERHHPDLLILDPALAYVRGDTRDAEIVGEFLRRGLNPILHRHSCAALVIHHTTKQKAEGEQSTHDFLYAGAGTIEWTNWARCVLALETKGKGCYRLHAPKRGARLRWTDEAGNPTFDRYIRHTKTDGAICWHALNESEIESASKSGKSKMDVLALVPAEGSIGKKILIEKAGEAAIGGAKTRAFLDELTEGGYLYLWLIKRPGTNAEPRYSRHPQPL